MLFCCGDDNGHGGTFVGRRSPTTWFFAVAAEGPECWVVGIIPEGDTDKILLDGLLAEEGEEEEIGRS